MNHGPMTMTDGGDAPPRDRIYVEHRDGRPAIVLPRAFFRGRMWMIFAFGLPFLVAPALADAGSGQWVIAIVLQTIGLGIVGFGVFFALIRQVLVDDGEQLVIETDLFGRPVHHSNVLKRDIDGVMLRTVRDTSKSSYFAVYLDASADRKFCLGPCLSIEELEWLHRTLEFWIRRGSDL